jgi:hypothetical protein
VPHRRIVGKTVVAIQHARTDESGIRRHAGEDRILAERRTGDPCAVTVNGCTSCGKVRFRNQARVAETVGPCKRRVQLIDAAIDNANDDARPIAQ